MRVSVLSTVALLSLSVSSLPAFADCSAAASGTVFCSGSDLDGFAEGTDPTNLIVRGGADVTVSDGDALRLDAGGRIVIRNGGTVATTGPDGDDAIQTDGEVRIINNGTISATDEGINADGRIVVTNGVGAVIEGLDDAVKGPEVRLRNRGLIQNIGTDLNDPQDAIDLDFGRIVNEGTGTIRSTLDAAIDFDDYTGSETSRIVNRGTISGTVGVLVDPGNTARQVVRNSGTLEGTSGVAVDLGAGADFFSNRGVIIGDVRLGAGRDRLFLDAATGGDFTDILFDGGAGGRDLFDVQGFEIDDITGLTALGGDEFRLDVARGGLTFTSIFANFETFRFRLTSGDRFERISFAALQDRFLAPVPLPAAAFLLLAGLGGLGAVRARRKG